MGDRYLARAREVGHRLADEGIRLVYGGGSVGLMGAMADACLSAGGEVVGVITKKLLELEVGHVGCQELIVVETMLERKTRMAELSDAFLSLPGGIGTLDELLEMLTWSQLDIHQKPSGLLNVDGFYDGFLAFLEKVQCEGFVRPEHLGMLMAAERVEDVIEKLRAYQPVAVAKWVNQGAANQAANQADH